MERYESQGSSERMRRRKRREEEEEKEELRGEEGDYILGGERCARESGDHSFKAMNIEHSHQTWRIL
jgi:hypothetical protein